MTRPPTRLAVEPAARETYLALQKNPDSLPYLAIRDILSELAADPGSRRLRRLRYRPDTWAVPVPVPARDARWLVLWRPAATDPHLIEVHYIGPAPGEP